MINDLRRELDALLSQTPQRESHPALRLLPGKVEFKGRSLIDFTCWDYLGLARHERVRRTAHESLERCGLGMGSSRSLTGTDAAHLAAERRLALFLGVESTLIFSSRNQAAFSLLTTICNERDVVIVEEDALIPAADAAYLVNAGYASFPGRNLSALSAELERWKGARRKIVIVEALRSVSGEPLPVAPLLELCARYGADVVVDESAAISAVGLRGAGALDTSATFGNAQILCKISELGPLAGAPGALLGASSTLISLVMQRSRAFVSEPSPAPSTMSAVVDAVDIVELSTLARSQLIVRSQRLRSGLAVLIRRPVELWESPIVAMLCQSFAQSREICSALFSRGVLAEALQSRGALTSGGSVRFLVSANHSDEQIDATLASISDILPRVQS